MPMPVAAEVVPADAVAVRQWIESSLDSQSVSQLPYSFVYAGQPSRELLAVLDNRADDAGTGFAARAAHDCASRSADGTGGPVRGHGVSRLPGRGMGRVLREHGHCGHADPGGCPGARCRCSAPRTTSAPSRSITPREAMRRSPISSRCEKTLELGAALTTRRLRRSLVGRHAAVLQPGRPGGGGVVIGVGWTGQWAASMRAVGQWRRGPGGHGGHAPATSPRRSDPHAGRLAAVLDRTGSPAQPEPAAAAAAPSLHAARSAASRWIRRRRPRRTPSWASKTRPKRTCCAAIAQYCRPPAAGRLLVDRRRLVHVRTQLGSLRGQSRPRSRAVSPRPAAGGRCRACERA